MKKKIQSTMDAAANPTTRKTPTTAPVFLKNAEPDDVPLSGARVGFANATVIVVAAPALFVEMVTSVTIEGAVVVGCP